MQITHRRLADRYPLRVTIVVVLLALVVVALGASGVVATTIMRGYLSTGRRAVAADRRTAVACLAGSASAASVVRGQPAGSCRASSSSSSSDSVGASDDGPVGSRLADNRAVAEAADAEPEPGAAARGEAVQRRRGCSGGTTWRVLAVPTDDGTSSVMVAQSLKDMDHHDPAAGRNPGGRGPDPAGLAGRRRDLRRTAKSARTGGRRAHRGRDRRR